MLQDCTIGEKGLLFVVYFKMIPHRDNRLKLSARLHAKHKVSEIANLVGFVQTSTPSRSASTMEKVSTDVQVVGERLLSPEWHPASCSSNDIP